MKELPMIFPTPSVQAILEGRKIMDRRVVKPTPQGRVYKEYNRDTYSDTDWGHEYTCPYGQIGGILWVRETYVRACLSEDGEGPVKGESWRYWYKADDDWGKHDWHHNNKDGPQPCPQWEPSSRMPKSAARIWLQVEEIKVERLQDISEEDAVAEGVEPRTHRCGGFGYYEAGGDTYECTCQSWEGDEYYMGFKDMWTDRNGSESWEANPWVWAVKFTVLSTTSKPGLLTNQQVSNEQD